MSYTPTIWENGKKPAINATHLNKIENELAKLDNIVSMPDITETTETTMPNSYDGRLLVEEIGGVTEQDGTSGKNLLKNTATTQTVNGVTFTVNDDGSVTANGTATADTYYQINAFTFSQACIVSGCASGGSVSTYFINVSQHSNDYGSGTTVNDGQEHIVYIGIKSGYTANKLRFYPMVRKASVTDATYEPFTNGASPNPSYPQEIKKSVISEIKTHGVQLFDKSKVTINKALDYATGGVISANGYFITDYIVVTPNTKYTRQNFSAGQEHWAYDENKQPIISLGVGSNLTFTTPSNAKYIVLSGNTATIDLVMLNEGTTALPYEPYTESSITLSQPIELYGIGDVQDVIEGGKVLGRIKKYRLTGEESIGISNTYGGSFYIQKSSLNFRGGSPYLCTHLKYAGNSADNFKYGTCIATETSYNFWLFNEVKTVQEIQEYLSNNEVYIYYIPETSTEEDLPLADQIALNSLSTYDGITYIEFDSEIEPAFKGEYGTSKVGGYTLEALLTARSK